MEQDTNLTVTVGPDKKPEHNKGGRPKGQGVKYKNIGRNRIVWLPNKEKLLVPMDKESSNEQARALAARVKSFFEDQLDHLKGQKLTPKEVHDMVVAAARVDELMKIQFARSVLDDDEPRPRSGVEKAVEAAAKGTASALMDKYQEMQKAGKEKKAEVIELKK